MPPSLRLEYGLTEADVAAGVDALTEPDARLMSWRPWLLRAVWLLLAVSGVLIAYLEASFWIRLQRLGMPFRFVPFEYRAAMLSLPPVWAALLATCWRLSRDPDGALRWLRKRLTRRLLSSRAPGPRVLAVTPAGLEVSVGEERLFRPWTALRRAKHTGRHLVLDARDLWFIVPLHALGDDERAALLLEVAARIKTT